MCLTNNSCQASKGEYFANREEIEKRKEELIGLVYISFTYSLKSSLSCETQSNVFRPTIGDLKEAYATQVGS